MDDNVRELTFFKKMSSEYVTVLQLLKGGRHSCHCIYIGVFCRPIGCLFAIQIS